MLKDKNTGNSKTQCLPFSILIFSQTTSLWWGSPYTKILQMQLASPPAKHFWPAGVEVWWRSWEGGVPMVSRWCGGGCGGGCGEGVATAWRGCGDGVARVWRGCGDVVAMVWRFSSRIFGQCAKYALPRFPTTGAHRMALCPDHVLEKCVMV